MKSSLGKKIVRGLKLLAELPQSRHMRRPAHSWSDLFSYACSFGGGFLNPLQRRSEICGFLQAIESIRPRILVEIGTAQGGNLFLLARACAPDACLISLDLPGGAGGGGYPTWKIPIFRRLLLPGQRAIFIRGDSHAPATFQRVTEALNGGAVDVLFIDGDHAYAGARQDFETYRRLVRPGGVIAFHDIVPQKDHPEIEVGRLWAEIRERYPCQEFVENWDQSAMGIGMVTCNEAALPGSLQAAGPGVSASALPGH